MIEEFNRLQEEFGRVLILVSVDGDSLVFRIPWWGLEGKEFEVLANGQILERITNLVGEVTPACAFVEARLKGLIRDDKGNLWPREKAQELWEMRQQAAKE